MKYLLIPLACMSLSGCVTLLGGGSWVAAHTVEIGQVALVAGAVAATESMVSNGLVLKDQLVPDAVK